MGKKLYLVAVADQGAIPYMPFRRPPMGKSGDSCQDNKIQRPIGRLQTSGPLLANIISNVLIRAHFLT